jgi:tRNA dimethylallyltransferase
MTLSTPPDVELRKIKNHDHQVRKKVVVLSGPTGVGKTAFSIKLAKAINGEIVSADSMQVYRHMDIGTAKASKSELNEVPHHLIDILDVKQKYNVVDFYHDAMAALLDISHRGKVPIVVGGTGFYIRSLLQGPPPGPPSKPELREKLEEQLDRVGVQAMYDSLYDLDPTYASTISINDKQKILRALEIIAVTGINVSNLPQAKDPDEDVFDFLCFFLHRPKEELHKRVELRCEKMLEEGFLKEVESLIEEGLLENSSAKEAIGYRQGIEFLDSKRTLEDFRFFKEKFIVASRKYIKRQFTWFRKEPEFSWIDLATAKEDKLIEEILKAVL